MYQILKKLLHDSMPQCIIRGFYCYTKVIRQLKYSPSIHALTVLKALHYEVLNIVSVTALQ